MSCLWGLLQQQRGNWYFVEITLVTEFCSRVTLPYFFLANTMWLKFMLCKELMLWCSVFTNTSLPQTHPHPHNCEHLQCFAKYQRIGCGISLGGNMNPKSTEGSSWQGREEGRQRKSSIWSVNAETSIFLMYMYVSVYLSLSKLLYPYPKADIEAVIKTQYLNLP